MANEDKNHTVFSVSEEGTSSEDQEQSQEAPQEAQEQPAGGVVPAEAVKIERTMEPGEPEEEIKHGYETQPQPEPESAPNEEEEKPKGFLSSLFGGGRGEKKEEEKESVARGMHISDIVQPGREVVEEKPSGLKFSAVLNWLFLIFIIGLIVYGLLVLGPVRLLDRITTFPQWFPNVFENWFESSIYPLLEPLVERFAVGY